MFEKVSRSLKYDSNFFFVHKHINIYMDTSPDHFTTLALRVRGKKLKNKLELVLQDWSRFFYDHAARGEMPLRHLYRPQRAKVVAKKLSQGGHYCR